jgi:hypothetical protein
MAATIDGCIAVEDGKPKVRRDLFQDGVEQGLYSKGATNHPRERTVLDEGDIAVATIRVAASLGVAWPCQLLALLVSTIAS